MLVDIAPAQGSEFGEELTLCVLVAVHHTEDLVDPL